MSIIDVCRKVARERNARKICAKNKSSEQRVCRSSTRTHSGTRTMLPDTIETNTGRQLSAISPAIPFAIRYAALVLSRFTVRLDGRTPFQYLLGTPYVSPLCMFGESVFALIPEHDVASSRADEQVDQWLLVGTRCIVRRTPGGDEGWYAQVQISSQKITWRAMEST